MKEEKLAFSAVFATMIFFVVVTIMVIKTDAKSEVDLIPMQATAYCCGHTTASGKRVAEGMCASKPEWIGCMAVVYERNADGSIGKYIGTYDIEDTGSMKIRQGKVIDIFIDNYDACIKFGRKEVLVQIIDGKG